MGYYDSVKDDIKKNESNKSSGGGSFDTLKESAEQNTKPDEQKGDDTPIEVVGEDRIQPSDPGQENRKEKTSDTREEASEPEGNPFKGGQASEIEEKLDKMIEQNQRMIEILESFGN